MTCIKMLLVNCSGSATDTQVAVGARGPAAGSNTFVSYSKLRCLPSSGIQIPYPGDASDADSTAAGWPEVKQQHSDKAICALFNM